MGETVLQVADLRVAVFDQTLVPRGGVRGRGDTTHELDEGWYPALNAVSFALDHGEVLGVVGPAGSGKSLLVAGALSLLPPWAKVMSGKVMLTGEVLWPTPRMGDPASHYMEASRDRNWRRVMRERIGVVLQDALLSSERQSVAGFVREGLPRKRKGLAPGLEEAAGLLRLGSKLDSDDLRMWDLSRGEQQRVALATALAKRPELLVLDEPFAATDALTAADVVAFVRQSARGRGMSCLVATNDLYLARVLCDRWLVLESGDIVMRGGIDSDEVTAWFDAQHAP